MYDLIIIGAGPGGYEAAIEASSLGKKCAIIERDSLGGTCLNRGCIPTKALLHASELFKKAREGEVFGINVHDISYNLDTMHARKSEVVTQLVSGIELLMKKNKIDVFKGTGTLAKSEPSCSKNPTGEASKALGVEIILNDGTKQKFETHNILIATGSVVSLPPVKGAELAETSDTLLASPKTFSHLVIVGGGVIGMEFATLYSNLGVKVCVIEFLPRILANMDKEFSQSLKMILKKRGVEIHTNASVSEIKKNEDGTFVCIYTENDASQELISDGVLICTGRKANLQGMFTLEHDETLNKMSLEKEKAPNENTVPCDEAAAISHSHEENNKHRIREQEEQDDKNREMQALRLGIKLERGHIVTDENGKTDADGIYAIGDCTGRVMLAHAASAYGRNAVRAMFGFEKAQDEALIPSCVYTNPEIASVGLTLDEAKENGINAASKKYPMSANGKSLVSNEERGFIKVVYEIGTERILGAQMMCARASDMISVFAVAIENSLTLNDIAKTVFAHPTYSEGIFEAVRV